MENLNRENKKISWKELNATKIITTVIGITLATAGIHHGFFEVLQGNKPTNNLIIQAIGPAQRMWIHGTEEAFTVIPNFLITGITAICIGILLIFWSIYFIQKNHGRSIFLLFCVALTLTGGGIGHIVFFLPTWGYATRMNKPLNGWRKVLPSGARKILAKAWLGTLIAASVLFIIALEISVFGYVPGLTDPDTKLYVCWGMLFLALILINITYISGFAHDLERQK